MFAEPYQTGGARILSALARGYLGQDNDSLGRMIDNLPLPGTHELLSSSMHCSASSTNDL